MVKFLYCSLIWYRELANFFDNSIQWGLHTIKTEWHVHLFQLLKVSKWEFELYVFYPQTWILPFNFCKLKHCKPCTTSTTCLFSLIFSLVSTIMPLCKIIMILNPNRWRSYFLYSFLVFLSLILFLIAISNP